MTQRNKIAVAAMLLVSAALVWFALPEAPAPFVVEAHVSEPASSTPFLRTAPELAKLSLQSQTDKAEVFRRAFWRNPDPEVEIRQAERSEWSDTSGLQRWDWFIAVDASDALTAYLLQQNPFQLKAISAPQAFSEVPAWFPASSAGFEMYQSLNGEMTILFNPETRQLYAKGKGHGFKPPAPAPAAATTEPQQTIGRLPNESPPIPTPR
ncbi:MAG: hypothetical protein ACI81V_001568 [Lentimonas sp.]|jgi:hypothetical protein